MTAALQLTPGMEVGGDFVVERILNAGGMGAVYVATQRSTGKARALKVMHPQLVADERLRARFEQEARVGGLIQSDHVIDVIAAGVDPTTGAPWIAMELLEGENLGEYTERHGCLSPDQLLDVLRQMCHAIGAGHRAGIVHRDIKPENVFVTDTHTTNRRMSVKVLDFGIAKVAAAAQTTATATVGSPAWMAPEQTDPKAKITPATDVWATGLLAFWLLTGRAFWTAANESGASMHALMREILFGDIPTATERAAELGVAGRVPEGFDTWFARCVARDVESRFEDAHALFDAYEMLLTEPTPRAVVHTSIPPASRSPSSFMHGATEPLMRPPVSDGSTSAKPSTLRAQSDRMKVRATEAATPSIATTRIDSATAAPLVSDSGPRGQRVPSLPSTPRDWGRNIAIVLAGGLVASAVAWGSSREPATPDAVSLAPPDPSSALIPRPTSAPPPPTSAPTGPRYSTTAPPTTAPSTTAPSTTAPSTTATARSTTAPVQPPAAASPKPTKAFPEAVVKSRMMMAARSAALVCQSSVGPGAVSVSVTWDVTGIVRRVQTGGRNGLRSARERCSMGPFHSIRVSPFEGVPVTRSQVVTFPE